jgi:hypothetical protein
LQRCSYPIASPWVALHEPKRLYGATAIRRSSVKVGLVCDELSLERHQGEVPTKLANEPFALVKVKKASSNREGWPVGGDAEVQRKRVRPCASVKSSQLNLVALARRILLAACISVNLYGSITVEMRLILNTAYSTCSYPIASPWVALHEPKRLYGATAIRRSSVKVGLVCDELSLQRHQGEVPTKLSRALGQGYTTQAQPKIS